MTEVSNDCRKELSWFETSPELDLPQQHLARAAQHPRVSLGNGEGAMGGREEKLAMSRLAVLSCVQPCIQQSEAGYF